MLFNAGREWLKGGTVLFESRLITLNSEGPSDWEAMVDSLPPGEEAVSEK